jgi:hypothetical protein
VQNAADTDTSDDSQPFSQDDGCTVAKCEKLNNDGLLNGCTVAKGEVGENGSDAASVTESGLGEARRKQLAEWRRRWTAEDGSEEEADDALRMTIREEIDHLSQVEVEFEKVMRIVRKTEKVASVPFMLTQEMKRRLRICGYSDAQIAAMTPEQAHSALGQFAPPR